MKDSQDIALMSFICLRSLPSLTCLLPTKSIFLILYFGPSLIVNVRFTVLVPLVTGVMAWITELSRYPFSDSMPFTIPLTRRISASSTNESRRMVTFSSFSFSSIFVDSSCLLPV